MILTIEDPDAAFDRAVAAGATIICPIRTEHAWRIGRVLDPFGRHWRSANRSALKPKPKA